MRGRHGKRGIALDKADTGRHMGRRSVLPPATVDRIRHEREGGLSLARIAAVLNDESVPTATGRTWHASTVRQVLGRP